MIRLLHAPRTGGTALRWALRGTSVKRSGHSVRLADLPADVSVITIVRDPVARFLSIHGWLRQHGYPVSTPEALLSCRSYTIGPLDLMLPQSWWLGPPERLQAMALWVGRTETLDADVSRLAALLGITPRLPPQGHADRNAGPAPAPLDPDTVAGIRERYADDYDLLAETGVMPKHPKLVTVVPSPDLPPTAYVRGVPARGRQMPLAEAQPLIDARLVVIKEPEPPADTADTADKEV